MGVGEAVLVSPSAEIFCPPLREVKKDAGFIDALIACQAKRLDFLLISNDPAFKGRRGVQVE